MEFLKNIPHRNILILLSLISLVILAPEWQAIPTVQNVQAASGGGSPSIFVGTTSVVAAGSSTTTPIMISNMPTLNAFEIMLRFDPAYLSPTAVTLAPSFGNIFFLITCLDGVGTGCSIYDGAGVVHIAAVGTFSGPTRSTLLFTVTWTAQVAISGSNPGSAVAIWCQFMLGGGSQLHVVNVVPGVYGSPAASAQAVFGLSAPPTINIPAGTSQAVTVSVNSLNGFSSDVALSASSSSHSVTATITPTVAVCDCLVTSGPVSIWGYVQPTIFGFISPSSVVTSQLTISTTKSGVFTVKVIGMADAGTGSSVSLSTTITVTA